MSMSAQDRRIECAESLETILEHLITFKVAAQILDHHITWVYRAALEGSGPKKRRLRFVKRGRESCTTRAWIAEFLENLTQDSLDESSSPGPVIATLGRRRREIERADRRLSELGV